MEERAREDGAALPAAEAFSAPHVDNMAIISYDILISSYTLRLQHLGVAPFLTKLP